MKHGSEEGILEAFGKYVRRRRHDLRLSQEELAERANLHRTYIADIERGTRNLGLLNVVKLARALEDSPSELLEGIGAK